MSYSETISYIYNLRKYGIKFGLNNINKLSYILGNPHKSYLSIHVAGTNGKGSTSAIIASILKASGLKVGLFTSPHLVSFTERIRVNGEEISENEVISLTGELREKIGEIISLDPDFSPTFFEVVTAMAFLYFQRKDIDIAVVEVGMGGRLDATNILIPEVSVITSISFDHMEFLGETLKKIASEKAGIIKDGIPVVISSQVPDVLEVINKKAEEKNSKVYIFGRDFSATLKSADHTGIYFDFFDSYSFEIFDLYLPLPGEHQIENVAVAIKTVELLFEKISPNSELRTPNFIREGLKDIKWPGRLEIMQDNPPILIDGAHNPSAAEALSEAIGKYYLGIYKRIILILGIMADKDIHGIMKPFLPIASEIILTSPDYERAARPDRLATVANSLGFKDVRIAHSVKEAIEMAKNSSLLTHHLSLIVITGSFYTIGEAKEALGHKGVLTRLRE